MGKPHSTLVCGCLIPGQVAVNADWHSASWLTSLASPHSGIFFFSFWPRPTAHGSSLARDQNFDTAEKTTPDT